MATKQTKTIVVVHCPTTNAKKERAKENNEKKKIEKTTCYRSNLSNRSLPATSHKSKCICKNANF